MSRLLRPPKVIPNEPKEALGSLPLSCLPGQMTPASSLSQVWRYQATQDCPQGHHPHIESTMAVDLPHQRGMNVHLAGSPMGLLKGQISVKPLNRGGEYTWSQLRH